MCEDTKTLLNGFIYCLYTAIHLHNVLAFMHPVGH